MDILHSLPFVWRSGCFTADSSSGVYRHLCSLLLFFIYAADSPLFSSAWSLDVMVLQVTTSWRVWKLEPWRPRRRNRSVGLSAFPEHHLPRLVLGFLACGYFVEILIYGCAASPRARRLRGDECEDSTRSRRRRRGDRARGGVRERAAECGTRRAPPPPLANPLFDLEVKASVNDS